MSLQYYNCTKDKTVLSLSLPDSVLDENRSLSLFICLDISGSMNGEPLNQAKVAILQIIEGLTKRKVLSEKDITCFFFESSCEELILSDHPDMLWKNGGIKEYFDKVDTRGGTNFSVAFDSIIKNLDRINNDLAIIFFTDGQDSSSGLEQAKVKLSNALMGTSYPTEVHSIGFSEEHDAKLLSLLTKSGSKEGNFIYVKSADEILNKMKTTLQLLESGDRTLYVKIGDQEPLPAHFDAQGSAMLILTDDASDIEGKKVTISKDLKKDQEKYIFESPPSQVLANDPMATQLMIYFIQREIVRLTNEISHSDEEGSNKNEMYNRVLAEIDTYDDQLNIIVSEKKLDASDDSDDSDNIIQLCLDIKSTVHKFKDIVSGGLKGTLTNESIAILNDLAYNQIVQQKITKKKTTSNRFCKKLRQDFANFLERREYCDVTIKVGPLSNIQIFEAHTSILYARSSFFRNHFFNHVLSSNETHHIVEIPNILPKEFDILLKYIYGGYLSLDDEPSEIYNVFLAAIELDLEEIINYLKLQLMKDHHEWLFENFESIYDLSQKHKTLVDFCTNIITRQFLSDDFYEIKEVFLIELLKNDKVNLELDDFEIWNRILRWGLAKHPLLDSNPKAWSSEEVKRLVSTFSDFLPLIRFFKFSSEQFCKAVRPYKKILSEDSYEELISLYIIPNYQPTTTVVLPPVF